MAECFLDLIFLISDRPFFSGWGAGVDFFQQLKLDFFYRQSESIFCVIQLSTIAIRPYARIKLQFHQISIHLISILKFSHNNELII